MEQLPRITKRTLRSVGIEVQEDRASWWVQRGHLEIAAYLWRHAMFDRWVNEKERVR